jgi:hypothetical protein
VLFLIPWCGDWGMKSGIFAVSDFRNRGERATGLGRWEDRKTVVI